MITLKLKLLFGDWVRYGIVMLLVLLAFCRVNGAELTLKIDSLNATAWEMYLSDNPTEAVRLSKKALKLANSIEYLKGLSTSNNYLGIFNYHKQFYLKAEKYFLKAIEYRKEMGYEEGVAYVYENLCGLRWELGDYPTSINYGFRALSILNKLGLADEESNIYINLGLAHHENGDTEDAHKYYNKGLKIAIEKADSNHIAVIYYNWANLYTKLNEIAVAEQFYKKALVLNIKTKNKSYEGETYAGLANISVKRKEYSKALDFFEKSIKINIVLNDSLRLYYNYLDKSELFIRKNEYKRALENIRKAKIYLNDIKGYDFHEKLNRQYATVYIGLKDYKNSFYYLQKAENYQDSIFSIAKIGNISRLQKENAEREKAEEELKNQQLTQSLLLFGLLSLGLAFGLYILNQRRIQKTRELKQVKANQERIIDQRTITETQKIRKELAKNLHNHVATPLTHIKRFIEPIYAQLSFDPEWQASLRQAIQIADNAHGVSRDISYQLRPEKIDWVDRIKLSMVALEKNKTLKTNLTVKDLDESTFSRVEGEKISSIITNLLSNVDKHADATKVKVLIEQGRQALQIKVADNGKGFDPEKDKGIGLDSIEGDVKALKGTLSIDSMPKEGTTINITIPN